MNIKSLRKAALAAVAMLASMPCAQAGVTNLLTNGSFENNGGVGQIGNNTTLAAWSAASGAFINIANGNADSSGFPTSYGTMYFYGPGNGVSNGFTGSPDGGSFVASDPGFDPGALSQTVSGLTPGTDYTLSFQWAQAEAYVSQAHRGSTTSGWQVTLGGETTSTAVSTLPSWGFANWTTENFTFTASSASETLSFLPIGSGGTAMALLDGVVLSEYSPPAAVPEPGTMVMAGLLSLGGGIVAVRRGRAKSKNDATVVA